MDQNFWAKPSIIVVMTGKSRNVLLMIMGQATSRDIGFPSPMMRQKRGWSQQVRAMTCWPIILNVPGQTCRCQITLHTLGANKSCYHGDPKQHQFDVNSPHSTTMDPINILFSLMTGDTAAEHASPYSMAATILGNKTHDMSHSFVLDQKDPQNLSTIWTTLLSGCQWHIPYMKVMECIITTLICMYTLAWRWIDIHMSSLLRMCTCLQGLSMFPESVPQHPGCRKSPYLEIQQHLQEAEYPQ